MAALSLIPWIVFGFLYCHFAYHIKFDLHKYSAQYYTYTVTVYGSVIISASIILTFGIFSKKFYDIVFFLEFLLTAHIANSFRYYIWMFIIGLAITFYWVIFKNFYDTLIPRSVNLNERFYKAYIQLKKHENNPFKEKIVQNFYYNFTNKNKPKLLLFDLDNSKVYIGFVYRIGYPDVHQSPESLTIIPVWSGYRDEKKHLILTTPYKTIGNKTTTTFRESSIYDVKDFNFETYKLYPQKKRNNTIQDKNSK
jgi:hypothetical protein